MKFSIVKTKGIIALSAAVAFPMIAHARHLSAEEALQMVKPSTMAKMPSEKLTNLRLVRSIQAPNSDADAVYVFTRGTNDGFLVLAADDAIGNIVLGYSDSSRLDINNLPPALTAMLDNYASYVKYKAQSNDDEEADSDSPDFQPIEPLCATKWDQNAPYNDLTPEYNGEHMPTGCPATALAQVLKRYNWPSQPKGENTYQYTIGDETFSATLDFSTLTFDWENMLNTYDGNSTSAQNKAVAELMLACGIAMDMQYGPDGSGSTFINVYRGAYNHFGVDGSLRVLSQSWYEYDEWVNLIYGQLSQGTPVLYCATNILGDGHSFVCDGCDGEMFHFNWGWGGMADGYYAIVNLAPTEQGTGGSLDGNGYDFDQSIIINIKPNQGSPAGGELAYSSTLKTDSNNYERSADTSISVTSSVFGFCPVDTKFDIGLALLDEPPIEDDHFNLNIDPEKVIDIAQITFQPFEEITDIKIPTMDLPVGEYYATLVFKTAGSDWCQIHHNVEIYQALLQMTVTESHVKLLSADEDRFAAEYLSTSATKGIFPGESYTFTFSVGALDAMQGKLILCVENTDEAIVLSSDVVDVDIVNLGEESPDKGDCAQVVNGKNVEFTLSFPKDFEPGVYSLRLNQIDDSEGEETYMPCSAQIVINVLEADVECGEGTVSEVEHNALRGDGSYDNPFIFFDKGYYIQFTVIPIESPWISKLSVIVVDPETEKLVFQSNPESLELETGYFATICMEGPWGDDLQYEYTYSVALADQSLTKLVGDPYFFQITDKDSGVDAVEADCVPAEYYNLQGLRIDRPSKGTICIVKKGAKATKMIVH